MTDFYDCEEVLKKGIPNTEEFVQRTDDECMHFYEINKCVVWIKNNEFRKVCLQFPDSLLYDSTKVAGKLQLELKQTLYVLGDTSYESCCIDYVAAKHIEADAIIHFGPACFSQPSGSIPCLYIYEKEPLCVSHLKQCLLSRFRIHVEVLLDTPYIHLLNTLREELCDKEYVAVKAITDFTAINTEVVFVSDNVSKMTELQFSVLICDLYLYNPRSNFPDITLFNPDERILKRRSYFKELIKDSRSFGILVGTVAVQNYLCIINRMKKLLKYRGKTYYIILVGKPTETKLANFSDIDLFILVGCPNNVHYEDPNHRYFKPIVTPHDVEASLNPDFKNCTFSYNYNSYLSKLEDINCMQKPDDADADVSLINGRIRYTGTPEKGASSKLMEKASGAVVLTAGEFLNNRSWRGLEQNLGLTNAEMAKEGRTGMASNYENEPT